MIIEAVVVSIVFLAAWVALVFYIRPQREYKRYVQLLKKLGYRVYEQKFKFLGASWEDNFIQGLKDHQDGLYFEKNVFKDYDIVVSNLMGVINICLINPDLIKDFYAPDKQFALPKCNIGMDGIRLLGRGLLFSQGQAWKYKRRVLSKLFTFDLLKDNIPQICEIVDKHLTAFEKEYAVDKDVSSFYMLNLGSKIFNGVMMKCFFGTDEVNEKIKDVPFDQVIVQLVKDSFEVSLSLPVLLLKKYALKLGINARIRDLKEKVCIFRSISSSIIDKRIESVLKEGTAVQTKACTDILQALIIQQEKEKKNGLAEYKFSKEDIINEFTTFLIAGTDSTAHFFMMMVYLICENPDVEARLRQEIASTFKTDEDINYQNLKKIVYIDWIQSETTRHYGPAVGIFLREAIDDCLISNIPITKGTAVSIQPIGNHYSEKIFKDPHVFRPQRWEKECNQIHPFALVGFSGGSRACIGKHLAMLESKIALIKLFQRYEKIELSKQKRIMKVVFLYEPLPTKTTFYKRK